MSYKPSRILMPKKHWTAVPNQVFTEELRDLKQRRSAAVYLSVIDLAEHSSNDWISFTNAQLARRLKMDERVLSSCIDELSGLKLIELRHKGIKHSHFNKNWWIVPAVDDPSFTPVPRFIFYHYIPAYPNAALLPMLCYYQHLNWRNSCWVGPTTLSKKLNWSLTRVRTALREMMFEGSWNKLHTGLPCPLSVKTKLSYSTPGPDGSQVSRPHRHYSVRAIQYTTESKLGRRRLYISKEFIEHFKIELTDEIHSSLSHIFGSEERDFEVKHRTQAASAGR